MSSKDHLLIHQAGQTCSNHINSICNHMMNGQIISKTYEFSSTTPLRYVDHENDPHVGERAYAYVVCVCVDKWR